MQSDAATFRLRICELQWKASLGLLVEFVEEGAWVPGCAWPVSTQSLP